MNPRVKSVKPQVDFKLFLIFENGEEGIFDVIPLIMNYKRIMDNGKLIIDNKKIVSLTNILFFLTVMLGLPSFIPLNRGVAGECLTRGFKSFIQTTGVKNVPKLR